MREQVLITLGAVRTHADLCSCGCSEFGASGSAGMAMSCAIHYHGVE